MYANYFIIVLIDFKDGCFLHHVDKMEVDNSLNGCTGKTSLQILFRDFAKEFWIY